VSRGPQSRNTAAKCFRFFCEQASSKLLRRFQMRGSACIDQGRQSRSPRRKGLVRRREVHEHCKILACTEPIAQPLRFLSPHLAETRPKWFDKIHLVTVLNHPPPKIM
jgi:hypothetical protein